MNAVTPPGESGATSTISPGASSTPPGTSPRVLPRLRVGQWLGLTIGVLLLFAVTGIGLALIANHRLSEQRDIVLNQVEPSVHDSLDLEAALINEETGVRGYIITDKREFLQPYYAGLAAEARAYGKLDKPGRITGVTLTGDVHAIRARATAWQLQFVQPVLRKHMGHRESVAISLRGKLLFDALRAPLDRLQAALNNRLALAHQQLEADARFMQIVLLVAAALILGSLAGAGYLLRRIITRPLAALGREAEQVAAGDFDKSVAIRDGPREVVQLGGEIDAMRRRIVNELTVVEGIREQLEAQALDLQRSNAELEQFAYVASHDLQEPLRKIASFCQALQRRYGGQLDERADQYIEFAVDGAKRMQTLINDLLTFSRVGRSGNALEPVNLNLVLAEAEASLSSALDESGATVTADELPNVSGERTLLVSLFQNLIGNAVKFRGEQQPVVNITVTRQDEKWQFSCADNGIGVEQEYAERIFVIFQRLHTKEAYPGTGIGLAMCRKIVEYHGGRMWLDLEHTPGAEFHFTLPIAKEEAS
ncbi:MAG TPA: ATP-binding protein [Solirubrobacteraceae bacterium]|nr:ATP-binding protein [Solirubrobacteraceae bacterium]